MFTYAQAVRLRFVAILSAIAALSSALLVKGASNDPLQYATWWPHEHHSGVLVVAGATVLGTCLVHILMRLRLWRWWVGALTGALIGATPGLIYALLAPRSAADSLPLLEMLARGILWGGPIGIVMFFASRKEESTRGA